MKRIIYLFIYEYWFDQKPKILKSTLHSETSGSEIAYVRFFYIFVQPYHLGYA